MIDEELMNRAAALLREGKLVAFPTETVYGLGADALNERAVAKIFEAKERPHFDPLIVHVASLEQAKEVARFSPLAERICEAFWPGALTLVLLKESSIPDIVTAGLSSVGVRFPESLDAQRLIKAAGCPLAAPSANPFGFVSPTCAAHVREQLGDRVDLILDGGDSSIGVESTVLSLLDDRPVILRHGGVPQEAIEEIVGPLEVSMQHHDAAGAVSPGQLSSHYAPAIPVELFSNDADFPESREKCGLLAFSQAREGFAAVEVLSQAGDLREAAANLFSAMRRLSAASIERIYAERVEERGLGRAIMDRLTRAAAK